MRSVAGIAVIIAAVSIQVLAAENPKRQDHIIDAIVDADNAQLESDRQIICRRVKFAGSHLKRKVCLPLGEWKRRNWTPRTKKEPDLYEEDPSDNSG